ncbi:MAG: galactose-1-phosphate uridylyltransferase [Dehalococcoidales bacterium]|nr:galactose-1-phosphate uridylyltransferase [Dehalococcoidales bacterium]
MSEMRQDPTTKEWVIIAKERLKRPSDFRNKTPRPETPSFEPSCPFCPGNENLTPIPVYSSLNLNKDSWLVRVFPNKFPALTLDGSAVRHLEQGAFLSMDGIGIHEVIVETPIHNKPIALMGDDKVEEILRTYRQRYDAVAQIPNIKSIIIFKNWGPAAGTSLDHPHSQLVAMAIVPRHMRIQYDIAISYYDDNGRCLYSDLIDRELEAGDRIVMETDRFVVFHPFASHRPFETWIIPKANQASFNQASLADIQQLAQVLRITLLKLYRGLDNPDLNFIIDSAPIGEERTDFYKWHLRIIPRISNLAGFEIGSGIYINTALPEETAQFMRELRV